MTADNLYIALVEKLVGSKLPDVPDGILVGGMILSLRRSFGDQPQAVYDCLDRELTAALRVVRQRDRLDSGWKN
jgi:hypothetical protein